MATSYKTFREIPAFTPVTALALLQGMAHSRYSKESEKSAREQSESLVVPMELIKYLHTHLYAYGLMVESKSSKKALLITGLTGNFREEVLAALPAFYLVTNRAVLHRGQHMERRVGFGESYSKEEVEAFKAKYGALAAQTGAAFVTSIESYLPLVAEAVSGLLNMALKHLGSNVQVFGFRSVSPERTYGHNISVTRGKHQDPQFAIEASTPLYGSAHSFTALYFEVNDLRVALDRLLAKQGLVEPLAKGTGLLCVKSLLKYPEQDPAMAPLAQWLMSSPKAYITQKEAELIIPALAEAYASGIKGPSMDFLIHAFSLDGNELGNTSAEGPIHQRRAAMDGAVIAKALASFKPSGSKPAVLALITG